MIESLDTDRSLNENLIHAAKEYLKLGYRPIPLFAGTKQAGVKWKPFQTESPTIDHLEGWFASKSPNIALVTGMGLVVVDVDDATLLEAVLHHCGDTSMRCQTPSGGIHLYYRMRSGVHYGNKVKIKDMAIDLRCEGAYATVPWSRTAEGSYQWIGDVLPATELPLIRVSWLRERKPARTLKPVEMSDDDDVMERRARAYVAHVEPSVSGQRGHDQAMRVAGVLVQKFRLSFERAYRVFMEWAAQCEPPWSTKEAIHKLQEAERLRISKGLKPID